MSDRYVDLDAFFAEQEDEPIVIKLFGRDWNLPQSPPAGAMLRAQRMMAAIVDAKDRLESLDKDDEVPDDLREIVAFDMQAHAEALIGADNLAEMLELGLRHDQLQTLIRRVMAIHNGGGGGARPNRAARRRGGRSS